MYIIEVFCSLKLNPQCNPAELYRCGDHEFMGPYIEVMFAHYLLVLVNPIYSELYI